ncbi:MAG: hypothetical protein B6247_13810 [Candidatus Parabeggiatoa sp. nov. 2]|nr:MAG: hypothetical protein B6247_13810 [Beggiatoa sp. 4572_84]
MDNSSQPVDSSGANNPPPPDGSSNLRAGKNLLNLESDDVLDFSNLDNLVGHQNGLNDRPGVANLDNFSAVGEDNNPTSLKIDDVLDFSNMDSLVNNGLSAINPTSQDSHNQSFVNLGSDALYNNYMATHNELLVTADMTAQLIS